ncbi:MAG: hypothetical protein ACI857_002001 [Arenicella sp.]|jgi:hypothetical protein
MLGSLIKRKIGAEKLANVFVNSIMETTENSFETIQEMITEDPAFIYMPDMKPNSLDKFLLIVAVGNLNFLTDYFEVEEAAEIRKLIIEKFANIFEMTFREFEDLITETSSSISKVNHPSKNVLYGMSKAVFHEFELNDYQEDYFKNMQTPNPLFLKRMDDLMSNFLWDWDQFFKKHKFNLN